VATTSTTLRSKGTVNQGNQSTITVNPSGGWALISNPFASRIDLTKITVGSGLADVFLVWDPKLAGSNGYGAYQYFTRSGADYIVSPGSGNYGSGNTVQNYIESGAAFFVQSDVNSTANNTITIPEISKVSGSSIVNRPSGTLATIPTFIANLYAINTNRTDLADGTLIQFDASYSNKKDNLDVLKSFNFGENFGLFSDNYDLAVERKALPKATDTIFFNMYSLKKQPYKLEFIATDLASAGVVAYLEDSYKATSTLLNILGTSTYSFAVDANAGSSKVNRFRIVFKPIGGALPVTFTSIKAAEQGNNIAVEWKVATQLNVASYEVEKSTNGRSFSKVASQVAIGVNNASTTYNWLDEHSVAGTNYYRIKAIDVNGAAKYTQIVKITLGKVGTGFTVSPNPVKGNSFTLQFSNEATGKYEVRLVNVTGQVLYNKTIQHAGGNASQLFTLPSQIISGVYQLEVIAPDKSKQAQKLLIDNTN
jgi:hypothetical protein